MSDYLHLLSLIKKPLGSRRDDEIWNHLPTLRRYFRNIPTLTDKILHTLIKNSLFVSCKEDILLVKQGDPGYAFYIVLRGSLSLYICPLVENKLRIIKKSIRSLDSQLDAFDEKKAYVDSEFRKNLGNIIGKLKVGDSFGELALIKPGSIRKTSIVTDETSDLLIIPGKLYKQRLMLEHSEEHEEKCYFVNNYMLFINWPQRLKLQLAESLRKEVYHIGDSIVQQTKPVTGLYFILSGQVRMTMNPWQHYEQYPNLLSIPKMLYKTRVFVRENKKLRESSVRRSAVDSEQAVCQWKTTVSTPLEQESDKKWMQQSESAKARSPSLEKRILKPWSAKYKSIIYREQLLKQPTTQQKSPFIFSSSDLKIWRPLSAPVAFSPGQEMLRSLSVMSKLSADKETITPPWAFVLKSLRPESAPGCMSISQEKRLQRPCSAIHRSKASLKIRMSPHVDLCVIRPIGLVGDFEVVSQLQTYAETAICMETCTVYFLEVKSLEYLLGKYKPHTANFLSSLVYDKILLQVLRLPDKQVPLLHSILGKMEAEVRFEEQQYEARKSAEDFRLVYTEGQKALVGGYDPSGLHCLRLMHDKWKKHSLSFDKSKLDILKEFKLQSAGEEADDRKVAKEAKDQSVEKQSQAFSTKEDELYEMDLSVDQETSDKALKELELCIANWYKSLDAGASPSSRVVPLHRCVHKIQSISDELLRIYSRQYQTRKLKETEFVASRKKMFTTENMKMKAKLMMSIPSYKIGIRTKLNNLSSLQISREKNIRFPSKSTIIREVDSKHKYSKEEYKALKTMLKSTEKRKI